MRTVIAIPPMPRMTGGIAVLYQIAARLSELGQPVALTAMANAPGLAEQSGSFTVLPWGKSGEGLQLAGSDLLLVPEGWPNFMAPAFAAFARVSVYVQNWAYLFSALPPGVTWQQLPTAFLAVSHPVGWFTESLGHLPVHGIVRPAIDTELFRPDPAAKPQGRVRIAWMPRKNKGIAEQIRNIATAMLARRQKPPRLEWKEIHGLPPANVAAALRESHIFLCTGFPEGCPLPPLEAMASGCLVTGFSGFGGWDYMRQARPDAYLPRIELRTVPWGGNGLFASDGDVVEAARNLVDAIDIVNADGPEHAAILGEAARTAAAYSGDAQRDAVRDAWAAHAS